MLHYRANLAEMPSYDVTERDWRIKLNANESTLNLPPLVFERVMSRLSHVAFNRYPSDESDDLAEQIAANFSVGRNQIAFGNGSSEIIEKLFFAFGGARRKILYPAPSFSMYGIYAKFAGAEGIPFALAEDYSLDREKFVATARKSRVTLAVICNPNNPTGTLFEPEDIEFIAKNIDCALLVDEAYIEFEPDATIAPLLSKYPNMIMARTFSKAYGLAAARVGYLVAAPTVTEMIKKTFMPYHMNVLSLAAADIVYQMRDEFEPRVEMAAAERERVAGELSALEGFEVYPSHTNFVFVKYARASGLNAYLQTRGIGVRSFGSTPGLENSLRISMGTGEENDILLKEIKKFVGENK